MAPLGGSVPTLHTYIHIYIHTHTHTHIYIYIYIFPQKSWQIPIFFQKKKTYMWFILRKIFLIFFVAIHINLPP